MGCPTGLVTAVAAVFISPGALLTPTPKIALFGRIPRAGGVKHICHLFVLETRGSGFKYLYQTVSDEISIKLQA